MTKRWALISVYDKDGIVEFAQALTELGFGIVSSGGTAKKLREEGGLDVLSTEELTGYPAMLGHRVVTLHPMVHGGILARPDNAEDQQDIEKFGIHPFELVVANLYPFTDTVASGASEEACIEQIDVGGPTMVRAAAKNKQYVGIVTNPGQYEQTLDYLRHEGSLPEHYRHKLAKEAFAHTAAYDLAVVEWLSEGEYKGNLGQLVTHCDYGENRAQSPAALYRSVVDKGDALTVDSFEVVAGRSPSYINFTDVDRLLQTLTHIVAGHQASFGGFVHVAVAVKHGNACGVGVGHTAKEATWRMLDGDPRAVFGAVVMTNFPVTGEVAEQLMHYKIEQGKRLLDGICAPSFDGTALGSLGRRDGKFFLATNEELANLNAASLDQAEIVRPVRGGFLVQPNFTFVLDLLQTEKRGVMAERQARDLITAWAVCATSNSNTVTLVKDDMLIGNGVGQQDRVGCCELAVLKAKQNGHDVQGAVAASDSFFPFPDGPQVLIDAGVTAIFSTTGSNRDAETQELCKEQNVALVQLPDAVARGFYRH